MATFATLPDDQVLSGEIRVGGQVSIVFISSADLVNFLGGGKPLMQWAEWA